MRLAEAALDLARGGSEAAQRRVTAGKVSPIEETRARVAQSGVAAELAQARGEQRAALHALQALLGDAQRVEAVAGEIALPAVLSQEALLARLQQAPALRVARLDVERLGALARLERTRRVPDVTVGVGAKRNEELGRTQALVTLSVPLPVADAWHGAELDTLQDEVLPGAQSVFEATTKGYELGKFDLLDVLDAQRTLLLSRTQLLRAIAQAHLATAAIDRALGDDTPIDPAEAGR
jgi:cobalt-zinc-cadmium efflux system outer membrane protein